MSKERHSTNHGRGRLFPRDRQSRTETARLIQQLCHAMSYVHSNGIVHRDIAPKNIILTDDGEATIVDFGLATSTR